jgi:hypothetical protein
MSQDVSRREVKRHQNLTNSYLQQNEVDLTRTLPDAERAICLRLNPGS